jgi:LmbE family N-acetylglucosaminyl deacetylase
MSFDESPRMRTAVDAGASVLFLSPHLDDAILSCGALLEALAPRCPVTVATLFTETGEPPHTYAGRSFLRQCRASTAATLIADRRAEDLAVLTDLAVGTVHLGAVEALYRARDVPRPVARIGALVPELVHRYPTYRYDIAKGRVSRGDRRLIADLGARVADLMASLDAQVVFCPVGVGKHVDHLITRSIGGAHPDRVVYYTDFPYSLRSDPDRAFIEFHQLEPWCWTEGIPEKSRLIRGYDTQVDALFPGGNIAERPERYYEPGWAMRAA